MIDGVSQAGTRVANLLLRVNGDAALLVGEQGPVLVPGDGRPGERLVGHLAVELEPAAGHHPLGVGGLQHRGRRWGVGGQVWLLEVHVQA